jgi:hypothetical protein
VTAAEATAAAEAAAVAEAAAMVEAVAAAEAATTAGARALLAEWVELAGNAPAGYAAVVPARWVCAAREAARLAVHTPRAAALSRALVLPMRCAVQALAPAPEHAVPLHADYLALCVHAGYYDAALFFGAAAATTPRTVHDAMATCVSAADVLCEQYYLAVVHIACRRYAQALQHCRLALAVPSSTLSDVAVATYRKYILVSLLHTGAPPAPPKISSYTVSRLKAYAGEYVELAKAFAAANFDLAHKLAASHRALFEDHANTGLVDLVVAALPRRKIAALTASFVTLRLEDVAERARLPGGAPEAEALLADMVARGTIRAKIDARLGVVRFAGDDEDDDADEGAAAVATAAAHAAWGRGGDAPAATPLPVVGRGKTAKAMDVSVGLALACVERVQDFRNAVLCDAGFVSRTIAAEGDHLRGGDGGLGLGMEEADNDID